MRWTSSALFAFFIWGVGGSIWCIAASLILVAVHSGTIISDRVIAIEGNIASGKTTLIDTLGHGRKENIDAWGPYLEWHDGDPGRVLATQLLILSDYVYRGRERVCERSWCSALMFAVLNLSTHDPKYINAYIGHVKALVRRSVLIPPLAVLYVALDPQSCYNRLKNRQGAGDCNMTLSKLEQLDKAHETLIEFYLAIRVQIIIVGDNPHDDYNVAQNSTSPRVGPIAIANAIDTFWVNHDKSE